MKKFTLLFVLLITATILLAQAPQAFNYQAVARDFNGDPLIDQAISVKISVLNGSVSGMAIYSELHDVTTNSMGLFTLEVGNPGQVLSGNFENINWGANTHFLKMEMDESGGLNFVHIGTSQLLSVPYALYSENTAHPEDADADPENELQTLSQAGNEVTLSHGGGTITVADNDNLPANELQQLSKVGNTVTLSKGGGSFIDAVNDADADPQNELQILTQENYNVSLSQGGGSFMTGVKSYTQAEIDGLTPYNGLTVHNATNNCINYYFLNRWFETCGTCTPQPTQATAGNDTIVLGGDLSVNLNANTPEMGEGLWSIVGGEGGTLDNATNPQTLFTGSPYVDYTLQWAITNACNSNYDEVMIAFIPTWQCGMPINDNRDGKSYSTIQIGDQCWMAENLNIGTRISGGSNQTENGNIEKYCYNDSDAHCDVYGGLYQWDEMMGYTTTPGVQGICPEGWHLPTDVEWCILEQEVDPTITCSSTSWRGVDGGGKLKETGTIHWNSPNTGATNSSGFTALPGGHCNSYGSFNYQRYYGYFWMSSPNNVSKAWYRNLDFDGARVYRTYDNKCLGFSVRCLKD